MRTATITTTDLIAGPVLIIRPGLQGHVIEPGYHDYDQACRISGAPGTVSLCEFEVVAAPSFELLEVAEATWEDAEWQ